MLSAAGAFSRLIAEKDFCEICGKPCGFDSPVCKICEKKFFDTALIENGCCSVCGKRLVSEREICMECRGERILKSTDGVYPLFNYLLWNKNLLFRWKLSGERRFSEFFANLVYCRVLQLKEKYGDFVIVPVPPRAGKLKLKGWDQILELSVFLEVKHGLKVQRILERRSSEQQKKLDRSERLKTISSAYCLKKNVSSVPEKVCLIDDVLTTGATIESCASILKQAGVNKFFAITLFTVA